VGSKVGNPRMGSPTWAHQTIVFHLRAAHLLGHWWAIDHGYWLLPGLPAIDHWILLTSHWLLAMAIDFSH